MGFNVRAFPVLRLAGAVLATAALAAAGIAYWLFVSEQRQYLIGRDFRVLANLATQIDKISAVEAEVVLNAVAVTADDSDKRKAKWVGLRGKPFHAEDLKFEPVETRTASPRARPDYKYRFNGGTLTVPLWSDTPSRAQTATLRLLPVLEPMFIEKVGQGAFESILLGDQNGKVLTGAGEAAAQIRSSGLGILSPKGADGKPVRFVDIAQSIGTANVSFADVDYTLFTFPCCGANTSEPLVLVGLIRTDGLRSNSWAISTTIVKSIVLGLLLAVVSWPFLKLILLGDRQRVRSSDFLQLGVSSVTGLALITIVLLDTAAYSSLNFDTDVQLQQLATELDTRAEAEVRQAYDQLRCIEVNFDRLSRQGPKLDSVLAKSLEGCPTPDHADDGPVDGERLDPGVRLAWEYPFFEAVAFIGDDGKQQWKFETSGTASNKVNVGERDYFKTIAAGRGWSATNFCNGGDKCTFEPVLSWTVGEPRAVLAKTARLPEHSPARPKLMPVAAISILMRSLINPVLPPGFAFAVIDHMGSVLFHSDRQRILNENFFVETDNNRRLRAEVSAHSAEPLNISYWGSEYRAYFKPMRLPDMYVITLSQKERAWAINREWLVVALIFVAMYLVFWLSAALLTLRNNAAWVWPDPARELGYIRVSVLCVVLILIAVAGAYVFDYMTLLILGVILPLAGWLISYGLLLHRPVKGRSERREPLRAYSIAAVLLLLVTGVIPGALSFVASYELHARSFIKSSQLIVARRLLDRVNRLTEEYLGTSAKAKSRRAVATQVGLVKDRDVYVDFFYDTSVTPAPEPASSVTSVNPPPAGPRIDEEVGDMVLSFLEDYLPYYSESSVEWRELLHKRSSDTSWSSRLADPRRDSRIVFSTTQPSLPVVLTSRVPNMTFSLVPADSQRRSNGTPGLAPQPVATAGGGRGLPPSPVRVSHSALLVLSAVVILTLTWGVARVFMRRVFLVGVTEPLWACGDVAINAGENVLEIWDRTPKPADRDDMRTLKLGPIVRAKDRARAWRQALLDHDQRAADDTVLIDDFDDDLGDARVVYNKLSLLEELAADQSRTIILVSGVSMRTLTDSVRHSARVIAATRQKPTNDDRAASPAVPDSAVERWRRLIKSFVIIERWEEPKPSQAAPAANDTGTSHVASAPTPAPAVGATASARWFAGFRRDPVSALLDSEGGKRAHPYVRRVCAELRASKAFQNGRLTWQQAFDEIVERTRQFYRAQWESCSEDERVVLGHIAQHGLANASVRGIVRRLLGRGLLRKDPALRPMNDTFRRFILTRECTDQVAALERADGPSTWDRLRVPLAAAVVAAGVFLFATQKELYNAIVGMTTAAAVSVPTLIRAVGMLAGRPATDVGERA